MTGLNVQLSSNFYRKEFACKCGCGFDTVDLVLIDIMQMIRERFGKPIVVLSGNRCVAHNASVGGSKASQHLRSRACDFYVKDTDLEEVFGYCETFMDGWGGLSLYKDENFIHLDTRSGPPSRW